jgi:hypothetical protein
MPAIKPKNSIIKAEPVAKAEPKKPDWWDPTLCGAIDQGPFTRMFVNHGVTTGQGVYSGYCKGILQDSSKTGEFVKSEGFIAFLRALTRKIEGSTTFSRGPIFGKGTSDIWISWPKGTISIHVGLDYKISIELLTLDLNQHAQLGAVIGQHILPSNVLKPVYSIAKIGNDLEIIEVGIGSSELQRGNYSEEVLTAYDALIPELQRDSPMGRLSLIYGTPGTGKSFLLRGLMNDILDSIFVLIPSHMVEALTGPELIPPLVKARGLAGEDNTIILLLEDADRALVPRDSNSLSAISSLLNASDGILGGALNLRVVCTTNAALPDVDEALKRPGRMSTCIELKALPPEQCADIYERERDGDKGTFSEAMTLNDVYDFINRDRIAEEEEETDDDEGEDEDDDEDWDDDDGDDDDDSKD